MTPRFGMGDYTRLLAQACVELGHEVEIYSVAETERSDFREGMLEYPQGKVLTFGWGEHYDVAAKCRALRERLELFKPDWVSLQFEYHTFSTRGFIWGFIRHLPAALRGYQLQLMMHELWYRRGAGGGGAERIKGPIRSFQYRLLMARLKPEIVHTSVEPYAHVLRRIFPEVKLLPIPGNIPISRVEPLVLPQEIAETLSGPRADYLLVLLFGRIVPEWEPGNVLGVVDAFARESRREVRLIALGENGYGDVPWQRLVAQMPTGWHALKLGPRDTSYISETLQVCDLALGTTPFELARKSGSIAAFLEHNLPVLLAEKRPAAEVMERSYPATVRKLLHFTDEPLPSDLLAVRQRPAPDFPPLAVARQMLADMGISSPS